MKGKWSIKAETLDQADILVEYINNVLIPNREKLQPTKRSIVVWTIQDCLDYYVLVENETYVDGRESIHNFKKLYPKVEFKVFENYILKKDQDDFSYLIPIIERINNEF